MVKRGEVWVTSLDPALGSEMRKTRPCVVVSPSTMHKRTQTVIVAPLTSSDGTPYCMPTMFAGRPGAMQLSHLRSIDRRRLVRRSGTLDRSSLRNALVRLREVFSDENGEAEE